MRSVRCARLAAQMPDGTLVIGRCNPASRSLAQACPSAQSVKPDRSSCAIVGSAMTTSPTQLGKRTASVERTESTTRPPLKRERLLANEVRPEMAPYLSQPLLLTSSTQDARSKDKVPPRRRQFAQE